MGELFQTAAASFTLFKTAAVVVVVLLFISISLFCCLIIHVVVLFVRTRKHTRQQQQQQQLLRIIIIILRSFCVSLTNTILLLELVIHPQNTSALHHDSKSLFEFSFL